MQSRADQWKKFYGLWQRDVLTDTELANHFLDDTEPQSVLDDWALLSNEFQTIVIRFLENNPPETLKAFRFGPPSAAVLEELTMQKQDVARLLVNFITIDGNHPYK
jgi:hypothetical protein